MTMTGTLSIFASKQSGGGVGVVVSPSPFNYHRVKITLTQDGIEFEFTCSAFATAACRVLCESGCESWGAEHEQETGHTMRSLPVCNFVEWMKATDQESFYLADFNAFHNSRRVIFDRFIEIEYDDGYTWGFINEKKDGAS